MNEYNFMDTSVRGDSRFFPYVFRQSLLRGFFRKLRHRPTEIEVHTPLDHMRTKCAN